MITVVSVPAKTHRLLWKHLLSGSEAEEVAFGSASVDRGEKQAHWDVLSWRPIPPSGFRKRSLYHLELTDETRAGVIKDACPVLSKLLPHLCL